DDEVAGLQTGRHGTLPPGGTADLDRADQDAAGGVVAPGAIRRQGWVLSRVVGGKGELAESVGRSRTGHWGEYKQRTGGADVNFSSWRFWPGPTISSAANGEEQRCVSSPSRPSARTGPASLPASRRFS